MRLDYLATIIHRRDGISYNAAMQRVEYAARLIEESNFDIEEVEDIMAEELGLELDFIHHLI